MAGPPAPRIEDALATLGLAEPLVGDDPGVVGELARPRRDPIGHRVARQLPADRDPRRPGDEVRGQRCELVAQRLELHAQLFPGARLVGEEDGPRVEVGALQALPRPLLDGHVIEEERERVLPGAPPEPEQVIRGIPIAGLRLP
jgi:hypothetical protein